MDSPWLTATEAAAYVKRGRRFVLRQIKTGQMRGVVIGERGEIRTRREWLDAWMEDKLKPVALPHFPRGKVAG